MDTESYLAPLVASILFSVFLLILAAFWPRLVRTSFILLFLAGSIVNTALALRRPDVFVDYYSTTALLPPYRDFITGFFSQHTQPIVLALAIGQLLVAFLLSRRGLFFRLGAAGACIFLLAITPLGIGSAFPATLILTTAILIMSFNLIKMERV